MVVADRLGQPDLLHHGDHRRGRARAGQAGALFRRQSAGARAGSPLGGLLPRSRKRSGCLAAGSPPRGAQTRSPLEEQSGLGDPGVGRRASVRLHRQRRFVLLRLRRQAAVVEALGERSHSLRLGDRRLAGATRRENLRSQRQRRAVVPDRDRQKVGRANLARRARREIQLGHAVRLGEPEADRNRYAWHRHDPQLRAGRSPALGTGRYVDDHHPHPLRRARAALCCLRIRYGSAQAAVRHSARGGRRHLSGGGPNRRRVRRLVSKAGWPLQPVAHSLRRLPIRSVRHGTLRLLRCSDR